jgi:hypothetical protein
MKLLMTTQIYENYAWQEDGSIGTGENAYWKAKGGSEYVVKNVDPLKVAPGSIVDSVRNQVEEDNEYFREYITDWELVPDDYLTDFERSQLEYEGQIDHPAKELEWN